MKLLRDVAKKSSRIEWDDVLPRPSTISPTDRSFDISGLYRDMTLGRERYIGQCPECRWNFGYEAASTGRVRHREHCPRYNPNGIRE